MKLGFTAYNFPWRSWEENIAFAAENRFDFIEGYGPGLDSILAMDKGGDTAALLRKYGLAMTVHHALPEPANADKCRAFRQAMQNMHDFALRENCVSVLSFDTWVDRAGSLPQLLYVLELFRDTDIPILTEDFPLNEGDMQLWAPAKLYPNWGLLSDLGHTNVRLSDKGSQQVWCLRNEGEGAPLEPGDNSPAAFRYALTKKPLPVGQVHIHNNDGAGDTHYGIPEGTADYAAIVPILREAGFDGYADLELSPSIHGITGEEADKLLLRDQALWRQYWALYEKG